MNRLPMILLALCPLAFATPGQAGEVNKCVDANGKVSYSSQPCPAGSQAEKLELRTDPASAPENEATEDKTESKPGSMQQLDARIAAEEDPVQKAQLEIIKQKCRLAKTQIQRYEDAPFLVRENEDGSKTRLSDEEAAAEKASVRQYLEENCR